MPAPNWQNCTMWTGGDAGHHFQTLMLVMLVFGKGQGMKTVLAAFVCTLILAGEVAWAKCWQESNEEFISFSCAAENGDVFISQYIFEARSFAEHFCLSEDADGFDRSLDGRQELQVWASGMELETHAVDVFSNPTSALESSETSSIAKVYSGHSCGTLAITGETTGHLGWDGMVFSLGGKVSDMIYSDGDLLLEYLSALLVQNPNPDNGIEAEPSVTTLGKPEVHLYGGPNRSVYLGCYNCSSYDSDSICNKYGSHGSKYSPTSVWNQYGTVGSQYSLSSPWNEYSISANVPVLVDANGVSYGYFTINVYRFDAFSEASS